MSRSVLCGALGLGFAWLQAASAGDLPLFPRLVETGHEVSGINNIKGPFAIVDADGDGISDLAFEGISGSPVLIVFGRKPDGSLGFKKTAPVPDDSLARLLGWRNDGRWHLLSVGGNGMVRDFDAATLQEIRSFTLDAQPVAAAVGDVDADGVDDLVVLTNDAIHAFSLLDGHAEWTSAVADGTDLALAQLDADAALEIIVAGTLPGIVLDGATRAIDWQYIDGFGSRLATGSLGGSGTQWVAANSWYNFTVFRASPWSPLWSGTAPLDITAIATAHLDANASAPDVVLLGDGQWGSVRVYDASTHQQRFEIPNRGYGVSAVAGRDLDGDGIPDIAYTSYSPGFNNQIMGVVDGRSAEPKWAFEPSSGPLSVTSIGDVDGDGREDLVAADGTSYSSNGTIEVLDMQSGDVRWKSPDWIGNANDPLYISAQRIRQIPHAGAPGGDIVIGGSSIYSGRIIVLDGRDMTTKLQIGTYGTGPMESRYLKDFELFDFNGDGKPDFVAVTQPADTGASGVLLQVFSGADGQTLWSSPVMGTGFAQVNNVLVGATPSGSGKELIAVLPGSLRAYNSQTLLLDWVIAASNDGASYIEHGMDGPEIVVFQQSGAVTFYNARTRDYLRAYALPPPVRAIAALGGDVHKLILSSNDQLVVVDGTTGQIQTWSTYMGSGAANGNQIATAGSDTSGWRLAASSQTALFRFTLDWIGDPIFADSFEQH